MSASDASTSGIRTSGSNTPNPGTPDTPKKKKKFSKKTPSPQTGKFEAKVNEYIGYVAKKYGYVTALHAAINSKQFDIQMILIIFVLLPTKE